MEITSSAVPLVFIRDDKKPTLEQCLSLSSFFFCHYAVTPKICVVVAVKPGLNRQVFLFS